MLDFLPIGLAFVAGLIAIVGGTWDAKKKGFAKLTVTGRFSAAILVCSFFYSAHITYKNYEQNKAKESYKSNVSSIISYEVNESLDALLSPFRSLYIEYNGGDYIPEEKITLDILLQPENLEKAQDMCLDDVPTSFTSSEGVFTWRQIFRKDIKRGVNRLERLLLVHSGYIDSVLFKDIHNLLENGGMSGYAYYQPAKDKAEESQPNFPKCFIGQAIGSHKQYLSMIKSIYESNDSNVYVD